jgi:phosphatidylglycerol---prolipoprotein diacylglyceryl transferase
MTFPIDITVDNRTISLHLVFETLALFLGFRYFLFLRRRQGDRINDPNRIWIIIGATFGAFFFSRLVGAFENMPTFFHSLHPVLYFYANKTIVGGLLGALLCVELTKKLIHERSSSGDLFTYPLILAMMIGRIGCFTSGLTEETYGLPVTGAWKWLGIDFGDGIPRHPVTLYEIAFLLLLWGALLSIEKRAQLLNGYRFQFFMIAYLAFRLLLDFIKPHYSYFLDLSAIQLCCLAGLGYYSRTVWKIFTNFPALTQSNGK